MTLPPRARQAALIAHVACSVGWLGAVAAFLALAVAGLAGEEGQRMRACYIGMDLVARLVIVPLALAALATGLLSSLGTTWGLFRHYWVLTKLALTLVATAVLFAKLEPIAELAAAAADGTLARAELRGPRISLVAHAAGGLAVLLVTMTLGVTKPRGLTAYGRRKHPEAVSVPGTPAWVKLAGLALLLLVLLRLLLHVAGHGPHRH